MYKRQIEEQAIDVVAVVFEMALSADDLILAMFGSVHTWPEPWKGIAPNMLQQRMCEETRGARAALYSAYRRMAAHLCAPTEGLPPMDFVINDERVQPWLLVVKLRKAKMEKYWGRACDLEDELDDSAVPEIMKMDSIWLAKALTEDLQKSDIGLGK